jgi:hypothetical protein
MVAGAQKCGTTALDGYLRQHPGIEMAQVKEPHFFDQERDFSWRSPDYTHLHVHFSERPSVLRGEATPITLYWTPAHYRVFAYNPDMRFILIFRNPTERAYSQWKMIRSRGLEPLSFSDAIRSGRFRVLNESEQNGLSRDYSYVERGFYGKQLCLLKSLFPLSNMLFLKQDDLLLQPDYCLNRICHFLDIDEWPRIQQQNLNVGPQDIEPMQESDRALLDDIFQHDLELFHSITSLRF